MTAIEFNHVSKQYRLGLVSTKTLSHDIRRWWLTSIMGKEDPYLKIGETNDRATKGNSEYVWALRDIDFKVEQGDVVGIIGKNGAGKSTLLKLLSRVTGPTTGTIRAHGRIGSLLEVGTGFHGEMTGRENIFMNGAILGMTRNEIQAKLDEIIDFSGCERYIDTPVKRYSSGMTVRLGFAVAAFLDPEILVVDEVLAVGDAEFQKKAIGKMKDVSQGEGRTVLFVSHNMDSMLNLCSQGVLLDKGEIVYSGGIEETVNTYIKGEASRSEYGSARKNKNIYISRFQSINERTQTNIFKFDEQPTFNIYIERSDLYRIEGIVLGVSIKTTRNTRICSMEYRLSENLFQGNQTEISLILPASLLAPGEYYIESALHRPNVEIYDLILDTCSFVIQDNNTQYLKYNGVNQGVILINPTWKLQISK